MTHNDAREYLRGIIKPGDTLYTILRHVSASRMTRAISVVCEGGKGISDISWWVAPAIDERIDQKHGGVRSRGCGTDMGFALVHNLSHVLFPDGFECIGEYCPSNDHSNGDRNREPHHHRDGGYAIRQEWL